MNISLTPELEELVANEVKSSRYQSASEVIREGLRLLDDQDRLRAVQLEEVHRKIHMGLDQLDCGEGIPGGTSPCGIETKTRRLPPKTKM